MRYHDEGLRMSDKKVCDVKRLEDDDKKVCDVKRLEDDDMMTWI